MTGPGPIRVVVLSSTSFGERCIREAILETPEVRLAGIGTTGRDIRISYAPEGVEIRQHADLAPLAAEAGCPLMRFPTPIEPAEYLRQLQPLQPELMLALGWYFKIPRPVRDLAARGCLGIHASLLPRFRGGAPIPWAIIEGETETGVTLFHLEDEVDAGDVVGQRAFPIGPQDTCATIQDLAAAASVRLLRELLPRLADGTAPRTPQDESLATTYPQRRPADGRIDWSWSARRIRDFIRAQTRPYPGAFTVIEGKKVILWDADVIDESSSDT